MEMCSKEWEQRWIALIFQNIEFFCDLLILKQIISKNYDAGGIRTHTPV